MLYTFPPTQHTFYPRCVFKASTGLDCPGCGLTRASHAVLHGRFADAWRLNPLLYVMAVVFLCAVPSLVRGRSPQFLNKPWFGWAAVIVVFGWGILRNLL